MDVLVLLDKRVVLVLKDVLDVKVKGDIRAPVVALDQQVQWDVKALLVALDLKVGLDLGVVPVPQDQLEILVEMVVLDLGGQEVRMV